MAKRVNELKDKYPELLKCSLDIGDGWYCLLDSLCSILQFNIEQNKHPKIEFTTVKEKFGKLRIYYYPVQSLDSFQHGTIRMAEEFSSIICEECGNSGSIRTSVWLKCLCSSCWEEAMKK